METRVMKFDRRQRGGCSRLRVFLMRGPERRRIPEREVCGASPPSQGKRLDGGRNGWWAVGSGTGDGTVPVKVGAAGRARR